MKITAANGKTYTLPKNPVWRKGPPPEIGWWPASIGGRFVDALRFWDGKSWSMFCTPKQAGEFGQWKVSRPDIQWTDRWWLDQQQ